MKHQGFYYNTPAIWALPSTGNPGSMASSEPKTLFDGDVWLRRGVLPSSFYLVWTVKLAPAVYHADCQNQCPLSRVADLAFTQQWLETEHARWRVEPGFVHGR